MRVCVCPGAHPTEAPRLLPCGGVGRAGRLAGRRAGVGGQVRRLVAVARLQGRHGNGQFLHHLPLPLPLPVSVQLLVSSSQTAANIILLPRFTGLLATLQTILELMGGLLLPKCFFFGFIIVFLFLCLELQHIDC